MRLARRLVAQTPHRTAGNLAFMAAAGARTDVVMEVGRRGFAAAKVTAPVVTPSEAALLFRRSDAVCFDVDSTVVNQEAIDAYADFMGVGAKVAELTKSAMSGTMLFEDALRVRLEAIQPTRASLDRFLAEDRIGMTSGIEDVVRKLHARGTHVYLVSGGFTQMIFPVADRLGIKRARVFANTILFNPDGSYAGFDTSAPTSRSGGKAAVVSLLRDEHWYKLIAMVGDGVTDLEARPPADVFVGFGGIVTRPVVRDNADWWVTDFADVSRVL